MTGVQTCALPIYHGSETTRDVSHVERGVVEHRVCPGPARDVHQPRRAGCERSLVRVFNARHNFSLVHAVEPAFCIRPFPLADAPAQIGPCDGIVHVARSRVPGEQFSVPRGNGGDPVGCRFPVVFRSCTGCLGERFCTLF